jgi:acetoin utilization deacetylase AcuC-like enzyme
MNIPVFYSPRMVADAGSYSPSAGKPAQVVESWHATGIAMHITAPQPVSRRQLLRAHDAAYVDGVLGCTAPNGFGNRSAQVAESLPYTCGAMLDACRAALANGVGAVAPCSGFHHAGHAFGGGFCTFNGLMVAATDLLTSGTVRRVGILDLDMHWGNGTQDILDRLGLGPQVAHLSRSYRPEAAERFLQGLAANMQALFADCQLLIYQAGADSHIDDPLGGYLNTDQMQRRDHIVFDTCRQMQLPVAWNLAGGYQRDPQGGIRPVLDLHDNTFRAFAHHFQTSTARPWNVPPASHASRPS